MPLAWAFIIVSLMPTIFLKLFIAAVLTVLLKSKWLILLTICLILVSPRVSEQTAIKGRVISIRERSLLVHSSGRNYRVNQAYLGNLDDLVIVKGTFDPASVSVSDRAQNIVGSYRNVRLLATLKESNTIRSRIRNTLVDSEFLRTIVFSEYHEDYPLVSSMAMSLAGVCFLIRGVLRKQATRQQIAKIEIAFLLGYGFIFGLSYGLIRLLLARFKIKREFQIITLLCLFPETVMYLGFLFPFTPDLLNAFSIRLKEVKREMIYPVLILGLRYKVNFIETFTYKIQQVFSGFFFC